LCSAKQPRGEADRTERRKYTESSRKRAWVDVLNRRRARNRQPEDGGGVGVAVGESVGDALRGRGRTGANGDEQSADDQRGGAGEHDARDPAAGADQLAVFGRRLARILAGDARLPQPRKTRAPARSSAADVSTVAVMNTAATQP
jgi:hypothetical protein